MKDNEKKEIIDYLKARGFIALRTNSGKIKKGARWITLCPEGTADIIGMHPKSGKFVAIEVKQKNEDLNDKQKEFRAKVLDGDGIHIVATSLEDVIQVLSIERIYKTWICSGCSSQCICETRHKPEQCIYEDGWKAEWE